MLDSLMVGALGVEEEAPITLLSRVRSLQFFFSLRGARLGLKVRTNIINTTLFTPSPLFLHNHITLTLIKSPHITPFCLVELRSTSKK